MISLEEFYIKNSGIVPERINKEIGHFNVFRIDEFMAGKKDNAMSYSQRAYYKIGLIRGNNIAEYADKNISINQNALLFATPKIPYNWVPQDDDQTGYFCIFTDEFLLQAKSGVVLDHLPIFQPGGYPVFQLADEDTAELDAIFLKMYRTLSSDYVFKYDMLRNYVIELIHYGQRLQPATSLYSAHTALARVSSLFVELLERQFPIATTSQKLNLRTAAGYADRLAIHVNYLNKAIKINTGRTTTNIINQRIEQEAKILLKQTDWNVSEIANCLGFKEVAHFSNFFRKQTSFSPVAFRS